MCDNIDASGSPIGHQIRQLRKARGWSLATLAGHAGTSAPTLHRYENGWDRFEVATLRRIAGALGAHLEIKLVPSLSLDARPPIEDKALRELIAPLFWDTDLELDHLHTNSAWVIGRVLMYGNMAQVRAVRRFYGDAALRSAVNARRVDERTRTFWTMVLEEVRDASQGS